MVTPKPAETMALTDVLRLVTKHPVRLDYTHGKRQFCPGCNVDLMRVGIPELAYVFNVCTCGSPEYSHLVEQLWHFQCLTKSVEPVKTWICPECGQGKHGNCDGWAWDFDADEKTQCQCPEDHT